MDNRRIWFDEDGMPLAECNDCGVLVPIWNELCGACWLEYDVREMERMYA